MNGWSTNNPNYKFTSYSGHYKLEVAVPAGRYELKIYSTTGNKNYRGTWDDDGSDIVPNDNKARVVCPSWGNSEGGSFFLNLDKSMDLTFEYWEDNYGFNGIGDRSALKVTGKETVLEPTAWRIRGAFYTKNNNWENIELVKSSSNPNEWSTSLKPETSSGGFGVESLNGTIALDWYQVANDTRALSEDNREVKFQIGGTNASFENLDTETEYTFIWNASDKTIRLEGAKTYPENIYLYGYVNNSYWDGDNYVELENKGNGIYYAEDVDISGVWSESDEANFSHKKYETTGNNNYVAFFDTKVSSFVDGTEYWKYGADGDNVVITEQNPTGKIKYQEHSLSAPNFKVDEGFYTVTLNLRVGTATFTRQEPEAVKYSWFHGDNSEENFNAMRIRTSDNTYTLTIDEQSSNIIQVGIGNNPEHKVARMAVYTVEYQPFASSASYSKRKAAEDAYEIHGTEDYYDNTYIELKQPGTFTITASLTSDSKLLDQYTDVKNAYNASDGKLIVTAYDPVAFSSDPIVQKFVNTGATTLEFALNNPDITDNDFTISLTPATSGWATEYSQLNDEDLEAEVESITSGNIDGVYREISVDDITIKGSDGSFTASIENFPCSGVYNMTIIINDDNTAYSASEEPLSVTIQPTVMNFYDQSVSIGDGQTGTKKTSLNVNGIVWSENTDKADGFAGFIDYPIIDGKIYSLGRISDSRIWTTGLYFADIEIYSYPGTSVAPSAVQSDGLSANYVSYTLNGAYNLSDLSATQPVALYVYVSKNGASAPIQNGNSEYNFLISASPNAPLPTAVDTIGVEEGEAVYYNLQGVRVESTERGIFVKVVNGKATKVVL